MMKRYVLSVLLAVITVGRKIGSFVLTRHYILYPLLVVITVGLISDVWNRLADPLHGLRIAPENRCSPYYPDDYRYSPKLERRIVTDMELGGRIYGPYEARYFGSIKETDIEHIVARRSAVLWLNQGNRHRTHSGAQRGPRLGALPGGRVYTPRILERPSQPYASIPMGEPPQQEGERRRGVASRL